VKCNDSVVIKRIMFYTISPSGNFNFRNVNVNRLDGASIPTEGDLATPGRLLAAGDPAISSLEMTKNGKNKPISSTWAVPFVMGFKYNITWGLGIDWEKFNIQTFDFAAGDWAHLVFPFVDHREHFTVNRGSIPAGTDTTAVGFVDPTLATNRGTAQLASSDSYGTYRFDNVTTKVFELMVNGVDVGTVQKGDALVTGIRCYGDHCVLAIVEDGVVIIEKDWRDWSDATNWPNNIIPVDGDSVTIPAEWKMRIDISTNILNLLEVNGIL
jgi:hypothetical protein